MAEQSFSYRFYTENSLILFVHIKAMHGDECVGAIVCKLDIHRKVIKRGYIAMLAVDVKYRKRKIGSNLVRRAIQAMAEDDADEVVLETEITNRPALRLYENLGFVRDKRLFRYYLNGVDALRLKLWLRWNLFARAYVDRYLNNYNFEERYNIYALLYQEKWVNINVKAIICIYFRTHKGLQLQHGASYIHQFQIFKKSF